LNDDRRFAAATHRNREPILEVLRRHVVPGSNVLEIASGSGEHALFLAPRLEVASWQPSDLDPRARLSIDAWREHDPENATRIRPAIELDVTARPWPALAVAPDVVVCINMIHIAPFAACEGVFRGGASALSAAGIVYLYGPYKREGRHTAPSNAEFDESLRSRNPEWGVRDMEDVTRVAETHGFDRIDVVAMPVNNFSVLFRRRSKT
jgi:hypothetical protein